MCFNFHTELVICSDLNLTNGDIVYKAGSPDNRPLSSSATYSCNPGYTLTGGSTKVVCVSGGRWNGSPPTCQGEFCKGGNVIMTLGGRGSWAVTLVLTTSSGMLKKGHATLAMHAGKLIYDSTR